MSDLRETLDGFRGEMNQELADFFAARRPGAAAVGEAALTLWEAARELTLRGGKRLRPFLVELAYTGLGGQGRDKVLRAACSIELMQTFLLVHDDVMDRAAVRRGGPTVHLQLAPPGDPHHGESLAILVGDLASAYGARAIQEAGFGAEATSRALALYHEVVADECYGQALDLATATRDATEAEALAVLHYKTTRYTVEGPLHLGAALAGADEATLTSLSAVARPLGAAFQLRDDLLGVFGDPAETGKPVGDDLHEGKRTLLVVDALATATPTGVVTLRSTLGDPDADLAPALEVIRQCGALDRAQVRLDEWLEEAEAALDACGLAPRQRELLASLGAHLARRDA